MSADAVADAAGVLSAAIKEVAHNLFPQLAGGSGDPTLLLAGAFGEAFLEVAGINALALEDDSEHARAFALLRDYLSRFEATGEEILAMARAKRSTIQ